MPSSPAESLLGEWYERSARDLPWRRPDAGAWAILVSEVMLQQTPVARVLPVYQTWLRRWPTPSALAREQVGEAVRLWGRLGYPRRARRLWLAASAIDAEFDGSVPSTYEALRSLPGVGDYTAAAVAAFAHRRRTVILDTNVRRVLTRLFGGAEYPPPGLSAAERRVADHHIPDDGAEAARWSIALMELGALVCTARRPRCGECPVRDLCTWRSRGYPAYDGPPRRSQSYAGTDRQCRGRILSLLRDREGPVSQEEVNMVWKETAQLERALASLICDGLVVDSGGGAVALP